MFLFLIFFLAIILRLSTSQCTIALNDISCRKESNYVWQRWTNMGLIIIEALETITINSAVISCLNMVNTSMLMNRESEFRVKQ